MSPDEVPARAEGFRSALAAGEITREKAEDLLCAYRAPLDRTA